MNGNMRGTSAPASRAQVGRGGQIRKSLDTISTANAGVSLSASLSGSGACVLGWPNADPERIGKMDLSERVAA